MNRTKDKTVLRVFYIKYIRIPMSISSITKELFQNSSMKKGEKKQSFSVYIFKRAEGCICQMQKCLKN